MKNPALEKYQDLAKELLDATERIAAEGVESFCEICETMRDRILSERVPGRLTLSVALGLKANTVRENPQDYTISAGNRVDISHPRTPQKEREEPRSPAEKITEPTVAEVERDMKEAAALNIEDEDDAPW
jgi:hypothetical protein